MTRTKGQVLLAAWLAKTGTSQRELGRRIGVGGEGAVCRYVKGARIPERREALAIERETGVPVASWDEVLPSSAPIPRRRDVPRRTAARDVHHDT